MKRITDFIIEKTLIGMLFLVGGFKKEKTYQTEYKKNCLKFKAYKALRVVLSTLTCFILFYCSIAVDGGVNVAICAMFTSGLISLLVLKKTTLFEKIYTNDGVKIERV